MATKDQSVMKRLKEASVIIRSVKNDMMGDYEIADHEERTDVLKVTEQLILDASWVDGTVRYAKEATT